MENPDIEITYVELVNDNIIVHYENDAVETLPNDLSTYKAFYELWLKSDPPFISDIYKVTMRSIILASIHTNNGQSIQELHNFFSSPNEETVKKFLTYMRKRVSFLPEKKAVWKVVS